MTHGYALRCCWLAAVSLCCCFGPLPRFLRPLPGRVDVLPPPLLPPLLLLHHPGCACCVCRLPARSCQPPHQCRCEHQHVSSVNRQPDGVRHHSHRCAPAYLGPEQLCWVTTAGAAAYTLMTDVNQHSAICCDLKKTSRPRGSLASDHGGASMALQDVVICVDAVESHKHVRIQLTSRERAPALL